MNDRGKLRWGILATGRIAHQCAKGIQASRSGVLSAVASRNLGRAKAFAEEYGIENRFGSYEELIASPSVDVVYVATPHPFHAQWAIRAAERGKHILCEKPLTINHPEAMAVVEAAREHDVFLMEAFLYRCHPQTAKLLETIRSGVIGQVRAIETSYGFNTKASPEGRILNHDLGGGGILDVGCYPVSMARIVAGAALGRSFADPVKVEAAGTVGEETRVDEYADALLTFPEEIVAHVATGVRLQRMNDLHVFGTKGSIHVPVTWMPTRTEGEWSFQVSVAGEGRERLISGSAEMMFAIEVDCVAANLEDREAPTMTLEDSLGNMSTLDQWRHAIGMVYDPERSTYPLPTIHGRPLRRRSGAPMTYGRVEGIDKPISRLVMGVDNQPNLPHASIMFDDFCERGGNCFDVAWVYGRGRAREAPGPVDSQPWQPGGIGHHH